jgi:hydrogenase maturation factor
LSEEEAKASLDILRQIADLEEETRSDIPGVEA